MSLFHCSEWYNTIIPGARSLAIAQLIDYRDQLIVGSLEGSLTIIDPGRSVEQRYEAAVLVEYDLSLPVIQVAAGKFLSTYDQALVAVLHPNSIVYFRLVSENDESFLLDKMFEHRLSGEPAFNMCQGYFGRSHTEQICVQSLSCRISVFDGENRVLTRQINDCIHPGPIQYTPFSESMLYTSGGFLTAVRYNVLTSNLLAKASTKKLNTDWSLNLGDTPLELCVIGVLPVQPSILVLCKRAVFCVTHGGSIRFAIRLQCVATCMMLNTSSKEATIQLCVGVSTKTLLFYEDTKIVWSAQLPFVPIYVNISSFSESLRCLLSILSDDCRIFVGYLGTEPSLFRMPVTESRFIDFEQRRKQLREYEELIWKFARDNLEEDENSLKMSVDLSLDGKSMAYDVSEEIPSATAVLNIGGVKDKVDVIFQGEIFAHQTNFSFTLNETGNIAITMFCKDEPVLDLRCQLAAISNTVDVLTEELILPLQLVCHATSAQKTATFKLSLDSSQSCLGISELFPEFPQDNQISSLGLQPYFSDIVVSIFVSNKSNRYRIQSNSTDFLYVVFSQLVHRIRVQQSGVRLHCPIPFHMFFGAITDFVSAENEREYRDAEVGWIAVRMRQAETILVSKLRSDRKPFTPHVSALINHIYREMLSALDVVAQLDVKIGGNGRKSLRALLNLMAAILALTCDEDNERGGGSSLPFDGSVLDGTDQKLSELIAFLLDPDGSMAATATTVASSSAEEEKRAAGDAVSATKRIYGGEEICQLIQRFCERQLQPDGGPPRSANALAALSEADEDAETMEAADDLDTFMQREAEKLADDFGQLRSGSMAVARLNESTIQNH